MFITIPIIWNNDNLETRRRPFTISEERFFPQKRIIGFFWRFCYVCWDVFCSIFWKCCFSIPSNLFLEMLTQIPNLPDVFVLQVDIVFSDISISLLHVFLFLRWDSNIRLFRMIGFRWLFGLSENRLFAS